MPRVRPLTQKQREQEVIDKEVQKACKDFLMAVGMKRGVEDKTYAQVAEDVGVCENTLMKWRKGRLHKAEFGLVLTAYAKMGYRLVPERIDSSKKMRNETKMNELNIMNIQGIECYEQNGTAYLKLETEAHGLGFTKTETKNGTEYITVRWERVFGILDEVGFDHKWAKDGYIPETSSTVWQ